jgi:Protein of unknown function (DUF3349)
METPAFLTAIIGWLRAGYPEGVPDVDYVPLFALLGNQLPEDEVSSIADTLAAESDDQSAQAIKDAIELVTHEQPGESDIARVKTRLAAGGWPLAKPDRHSWPEAAS